MSCNNFFITTSNTSNHQHTYNAYLSNSVAPNYMNHKSSFPQQMWVWKHDILYISFFFCYLTCIHKSSHLIPLPPNSINFIKWLYVHMQLWNRQLTRSRSVNIWFWQWKSLNVFSRRDDQSFFAHGTFILALLSIIFINTYISNIKYSCAPNRLQPPLFALSSKIWRFTSIAPSIPSTTQ